MNRKWMDASISKEADLDPAFDPDRWVPPRGRLGDYRVVEFMRRSGIGSYAELVDRATATPEWFYPAALDFLGLPWMRPWTSVYEDNDGPEFGHWFVGGRTNIAWLIERGGRPDDIALIWEGDDGSVEQWRRSDLLDAASRVARSLKDLGVDKGDTVVIHLPMIPHAVVALIAVAWIGAIAAPAFSGYGADALAERLRLSGAKLMITADVLRRRGQDIRMAPTALTAAETVEWPVKIVLVGRRNDADARPSTVLWRDLLAGDPSGPPEEFDAEHPWLLTFTSGSTGRPKGAVHTHGGIPYGGAIEQALHFDVGPGDRLAWPSDMGWIVGPLLSIVPLVLGATPVLFEGVFDFPQPDRYWRLVEDHRLTHLGFAPTVARMMAKAGDDWVDKYSLDSLRVLGMTGEPVTVPAWQWVHRHVGRGRVPIINWAGGTEIGGGILMGSPAVETVAGRFSGPSLGMNADVVDDSGAPVVGQVGELVLRRSWPSMTRGFWHENQRYLDTYWSRFPGIWVHGDRAVRFADGSWDLQGRSDDVLKIAGRRIGPSDLESVAMEVPGVLLAGAVGYPDDIRGEVLVIAVTLDATAPLSTPADVERRVVDALGSTLRPKAVVALDELPLTRSGKVHRRVLKAWLAGTEPGDLSSLLNPEARAAAIDIGKRLRAAGPSADSPTA